MHATHWLDQAVMLLNESGIGTARLDALVLLEDATGRDRSWLLAHPEFELNQEQVRSLEDLLQQRTTHLPLAYIRGKTEFYGRTFLLNSHVLEPRPESESMIDLLKSLPLFTSRKISAHSPEDAGTSTVAQADHPTSKKGERTPKYPTDPAKIVRIADVGTGSGALGITAQLELQNTEVDLLEIDEQAMQVAQSNVDLFTLNIRVIQSDLLEKSAQNYDVLLCNLPYVPDTYTLNTAALHEPKIAIFGGPDGLDIYRKLFDQIKIVDQKPLYILTEALPPQHTALAAIAEKHGYRQQKVDDFIQLFERV
jgi:release factor glutamine methyltransferase